GRPVVAGVVPVQRYPADDRVGEVGGEDRVERLDEARLRGEYPQRLGHRAAAAEQLVRRDLHRVGRIDDDLSGEVVTQLLDDSGGGRRGHREYHQIGAAHRGAVAVR